jgi:MFS family permease
MAEDAIEGDDAHQRLIPQLPRTAKIVLLGDAVSALGQGMSLPFLVIYLHDVRGITLSTAGLVLSTVALASFVGNPIGGWISDHLGSRTALLISLVVSAVGVATFALAAAAPLAFLASALLGLGNAIAWPAFDALLADLVEPGRRSGAFSLRHATMNAGMAVGALVAGLVVDTARPGTFQTIYVIDALTFLLFIPLLLTIPARRTKDVHPEFAAERSYRIVLQDRLFLSLVGLTALIVAVGFSQYHAAFPVWATRDGGIPVSALGICFAANAATVIFGQLPMLRALIGHRRTTAVCLGCATWAISWSLALIFGFAGSGWPAQAGFVLTMVVFGIAETALAPTLPAIVNDLAPDHLRGRYNGVSALGWTTGFFIGPAIAGFALDADAGAALLIALIACCVFAAVWATSLGRHLPEAANTIAA